MEKEDFNFNKEKQVPTDENFCRDDGDEEQQYFNEIEQKIQENMELESLDPQELISNIYSGKEDIPLMLTLLRKLPYVPAADDEFLGFLITLAGDFSAPDIEMNAFALLARYTHQYPAITNDFFRGELKNNIINFISSKPTQHLLDFITVMSDSFEGFDKILDNTLIAQSLFQNSQISNDEDMFYFLSCCNIFCENLLKSQPKLDFQIFQIFYLRLFELYQNISEYSPNTYIQLLKSTLNILKIIPFDVKFLEKDGPLEILRKNYTNEIIEIEVLTFQILHYVMDQNNISESLKFEDIKTRIRMLIEYARKHDVLGYARTKIDEAHIEGQKEIIKLTCSVLKLRVPETPADFIHYQEDDPFFYVNQDELETSLELGLADFLIEALDGAPLPIKIESIKYVACLLKGVGIHSIYSFLCENQVMTQLIEILPHVSYEIAFYIVVSIYLSLKKFERIISLQPQEEEEEELSLENLLPLEELDQLTDYTEEVSTKSKYLEEKDTSKYSMDYDTPSTNKYRIVDGIFQYSANILELFDESYYIEHELIDAKGDFVNYKI